MILNLAEKLLLGQRQIQAAWLGSFLVWNGGVSNFSLDVSRFSAENPVLYSSDGRAAGSVSMISGSLSDIHPVQGGLYVTGSAAAVFPVRLPADRKWTIVLRFSDFPALSAGIQPMFSGEPDGILETRMLYSAGSLRMDSYLNRGKLTAYRCGEGVDVTYGDSHNSYLFADGNLTAGYPSDGGSHELRWVHDGQMLSLYLDGLLTASQDSTGIPDITCLRFPASAGQPGNAEGWILRAFSIRPGAEPPTSYRLRITRLRSVSRSAVSLGSLHLFCANDLAADMSGTPSRAKYNNETAAFAEGRSQAELFAQNSHSMRMNGWTGSGRADIFFVYDGKPPAAYSFTTSADAPECDPSSWSLSVSRDGGRSWEVLDSRTDTQLPEERLAETKKFRIGKQHGYYFTSDDMRLCTSDGMAYGLQEG